MSNIQPSPYHDPWSRTELLEWDKVKNNRLQFFILKNQNVSLKSSVKMLHYHPELCFAHPPIEQLQNLN